MDTKSLVIGLLAGVIAGVFVGTLVPERDAHFIDMETKNMSMDMDGMEMDSVTMDPDPVEVTSDAPSPTIEIVSAERDMMGAYSVLIETTNFTFTPENVDSEPVQNEGHAHIYVNDVKVGREYAPWIYVPASFFVGEGPYTITATLNANTHGEWTLLDAPIQATVVVD